MKIFITTIVFTIFLFNLVDSKPTHHHQNATKNAITANLVLPTTHTTVKSKRERQAQEIKLLALIDNFMKYLKYLTENNMPTNQKKLHIVRLNKLKNEILDILEKQPELYQIDFDDEDSSEDERETKNDGTIKKPFKWGR